MKKAKKFLRFSIISALVLVVWSAFCQLLFKLLWKFDIFDKASYLTIYDFWERGGVFHTFRDYSLGLSLFSAPIIWLILSYKLYKFGLLKFLSIPLIKTYRYFAYRKNTDPEHVVIKNLGGAGARTLDDIIAQKLEEKGENKGAERISRNLRQQISVKIEENEKQ